MKTVHSHLAFCTAWLAFSMSAFAGSTTAAMKAIANGESVIGKSAYGHSLSFPDVCKTPSPGGPVAIPYPNTDTSSEKTAATKKRISGTKPETKDISINMRSGDKAGTQQGVTSESVLFSSRDVQFEGKLVIRQSSMIPHNNAQSNRVQAAPSVTEVAYIDDSGREVKLRQSTLIEMRNGEYCAVCMVKGKVTAIHRLLTVTPKHKKRRTQ